MDNDNKYFIYAIILGLIGSLPLLLGISYGLDAGAHYKIGFLFYESSLEGNFYPSWAYNFNDGYGDATPRFYPPGLYFLFSFVRHLTGNWAYVSLLSFTLINIVASCGMYLWLSQLVPKHYALFSIIFYLFAPFHANQFYQGAMYSQYLAATFLILSFASVEYAINKKTLSSIAYLGLSSSGLVLCNVPTTTFGFIAVGTYVVIRLKQSFSYNAIIQLFLGTILGTTICSFYLLPLLREVKWKADGGIGQGEWFNYKNQFLFNIYLSEDSNFWLTQLFIFTIFISIPGITLLKAKNTNSLAIIVTFFISIFMTTNLSKPIWDLIPPLQQMQFPWRWLNLTSILTCAVLALSLPKLNLLRQTKWRPIVIILIGFPIISISFTVSQVLRGSTFNSFASMSTTINSIKTFPTYSEFLPIWAKTATKPMKTNVEISDRTINIIKWSGEEKIFQISEGKPTQARLKLFYYPYWKATSEATNLICSPDSDGALLINVPEKASTIRVKFVEPLTSNIAGGVSFVAFLVALLLIFYPKNLHSPKN